MTQPRKWLNETSKAVRQRPFPDYLSEQPTNLELITELYYCNGGNFDFRPVGRPANSGAFGYLGLDPGKSLIFYGLVRFLEGLSLETKTDWRSTIKAEAIRIDCKFKESDSVGTIVLPEPGDFEAVGRDFEEIMAGIRVQERKTVSGLIVG